MFAQSKEFAGSVYYDANVAYKATKDISVKGDANVSLSKKKSPLLSGLMSIVVPGAGQAYNGDWWKTAIFVAAEATAVTLGLIYDGKGDDQTEVFENYANKHWDVKKYARWTINNIDHIKANIPGIDDLDVTTFNVFKSNGDVNWNELNRLEQAIGGWYSHQLEHFGHQQYYEMIGKYPQFNPGWEDFDENSLFTYTSEKPDDVTKKFHYYSGLRGKANDYYNKASTAVTIVVTNHILSAIEAAWTTAHNNKKLSVNASVGQTTVGFYTEYYPQLNFSLSL